MAMTENCDEVVSGLNMCIPFMLVAGSIAYGQSLSDCKFVAAMFDNTCDSNDGNYNRPAENVTAVTPELVTCLNKPRCIPSPGGVPDGSTCTWQRRLCVTCRRDDADIVQIRVQTNNMPNHCISSDSVKPQAFDYEVRPCRG